MENKSYQLRYLPMFETDVSSKVYNNFSWKIPEKIYLTFGKTGNIIVTNE